MSKKRNIKQTLIMSVLSVVISIAMFIGATFAWFTDNVTSSGNIIKSGNLDIEMYWTDDLDSGTWYNVEDSDHNTIFGYDNWEPGYTEVRYIKIVNNGNLALNYDLTLTPQNSVGKLAEVINVYFADSEVEVQTREDLSKLGAIGLLNNVLDGGATASGTLLAANQSSPLHKSGETIVTMAMNMITTAGNDYQDESVGDFTITALATQAPYEQDSFGSNYDSDAEMPAILTPGKVSADVTPDNGKVPSGGVNLSGEGISAFVPAGVAMEDGANKLTLSITPLKNTTSDITVVNNEILIPVDVHIDGVAEDNTVPIVIELGEVLPKYMNMGNYHLFHVEDGTTSKMTLVNDASELTAHNTFTYDPLTGEVSVAMASFSEVTMLADTSNAWEGNTDVSWYDANKTELTIANADQLHAFSQIVGGIASGIARDSFEGKTVKLLSDINLNHGNVVSDEEKGSATTTIFYPIGYNNNKEFVSKNNCNRPTTVETNVESTVYSFEGVFDGDGHTISNFYQNTWEMFGDYNDGYSGTPNYYKDAMGLFGYVVNGAVKNLTVDKFKSDGEFTPTGVIAAYAANSTFENIAITHCNPRVYNTGNGGIIGIAGREHETKETITLKNITVDNTNIISALWGSWDVACGGLVGMYRGNADANGDATGDTVNFDNCHVAAQIDVYNDVCGNYQYYAYRYAGMIIGSIRHNTTNEEGKVIPNMAGVSASGCTVNYGDWNDYYYCEFEENTMASYSEDYQFSRVPNDEIDISKGKEQATCIGHEHTDAEDKRAVYLPFHQLFTGYSWGVNSIGLKEYSGIVTDLDITEGDQNESVAKFESKFINDYLYRVGNQNTVYLESLFQANTELYEDEKPKFDENGKKLAREISDTGVYVSVDKVDENSNVSGTFTANTTDWKKGTIQFSGTGVVKVTIQDYDFCKPTVLYLEVVDATNLTSATGTTNGGNFVLLCDVNTASYVYYWNCSLYGNGFTYSLNGAPTNYSSSHGHGVLMTKNATLDNLVIVGDVYDEYGAYTTNNDYNAAIDIMGETVIQNCYISGCSAPISTRANATITNTTLYGGTVGNLIIKGGKVSLKNVTTANYDDGRTLIGMGIVVHSDATKDAKLVLDGKLTQYNFISEAKIPSDSYAKNLHNAMFSDSCSQYHFGTSPNRYVNTGIISLTSKFNIEDITDNANTGYVYQSVSASGFNGYVYTQPNTSGSVNNNYDKETDSNVATTQGAVPPSYNFDYTTKNFVAKTDGSNDYCYLENDIVKISMDDGDAFNWDTAILNVTKGKQNLNYTVSMNGIDYTNKSIAFNTAGNYEVVYTYTDSNNYKLDQDGNITTYSETYTKTVNISVAVIKATTKHAEFTLGSSKVATEKITVGTKTYISATGVSHDNSTWSYITVEGTKIYYPIVEATIVDNKVAYFNVLKNVVSITDYADGGSGAAVTYNSSTTSMPSGLTVVKGIYKPFSDISSNWSTLNDTALIYTGASNVFKYAGSAAASATPKPYSSALCFASPEVTNPRDEYITMVQYSYTDAANTTYYYYVGYHMAKKGDGSCVTSDTLITLADGSQVRVDSLIGSEQLLVWNMETGSLDSAPLMFVDSEAEATYEVIKLYFSDGTEVKVISEHGFWDYDLNKYVYLDRYADKYIGHTFAKQNGDVLEKVQLVDVVLENQVTTAWSPVTTGHLCYFVNGMLSMPGGVGGLFNIFDVDAETMTYDYEAMARDIETYGLFTYEELSQYTELSRDMFDAAGGQYLKVSIGKGNLTEDELIAMIERYSKYFE